jgi:hypothetical protein
LGVAILLDDGSWEIQGRRVRFPVRITDGSAACAAFLVSAAHVRRLLAGTGLRAVALAGRTPLFLMFVEYRESDLDAYAEVGVALPVRHGGRLGVHIHQLPVTQTFTMEAGRALWGLPKWLAEIELAIRGRRVSCDLAESGRPVLAAELRTSPGQWPATVPVRITALAPRAGSVLASAVRLRARGIRLGVRGGAVALGSGHPMADELRAMGLARRPLLTVVVDRLAFEMDAAVERPLSGGPPATS